MISQGTIWEKGLFKLGVKCSANWGRIFKALNTKWMSLTSAGWKSPADFFSIKQNRINYGFTQFYAFNFVYYVLWKNCSDLKGKYSCIEFKDFKFTYRRSIEHWFPQNPNGYDGESQLPAEFLHSFGNLCIITDSQKSRFGNSYPEVKLEQWEREGIFHRQSLKLQIMADITKKTK